MSRRIISTVGIIALLAMAVPAQAAPLGSEFVGTWQSQSGRLVDRWTIRNTDGAWSMQCIYLTDGKQVGSFRGKDVKLVDGMLVFEQRFEKKPNPGWLDGTIITCTLADDTIQYTWRNGGLTGSGSMKRAKNPAP